MLRLQVLALPLLELHGGGWQLHSRLNTLCYLIGVQPRFGLQLVPSSHNLCSLASGNNTDPPPLCLLKLLQLLVHLSERLQTEEQQREPSTAIAAPTAAALHEAGLTRLVCGWLAPEASGSQRMEAWSTAHQMASWAIAEGLARHVPAAAAELMTAGVATWTVEKTWMILDAATAAAAAAAAAATTSATATADALPIGASLLIAPVSSAAAAREAAAAAAPATRRLITAAAATAAAKDNASCRSMEELHGLRELGQLVLVMEAMCTHSHDARRMFYTSAGVERTTSGEASARLSHLLSRLLPLLYSPLSPPQSKSSKLQPSGSQPSSSAAHLFYPLLRLLVSLVEMADGESTRKPCTHTPDSSHSTRTNTHHPRALHLFRYRLLTLALQ